MKIFTSAQIHELDNYTIEHEPVKSIDLMERAAKVLTRAITHRWPQTVPVITFAGPGNNGGDALAVSRMLTEQGYQVHTFLFNINGHLSADCAENKRRLLDNKKSKNSFVEVTQEFDPPQLGKGILVIDGLFGSGLNKPLNGGFASLVKYINASAAEVVSIDMPSGLMTEDNTYNVRTNIIHADLTLTLGHKKLSMLFPENQQFVGDLEVLDINLSREGIDKIEAHYTLIEEDDIRRLMLSRSPFAHKGNMGHALIIAGSYGMAGAAILATEACLRSGAGKVYCHTPRRMFPFYKQACQRPYYRLTTRRPPSRRLSIQRISGCRHWSRLRNRRADSRCHYRSDTPHAMSVSVRRRCHQHHCQSPGVDATAAQGHHTDPHPKEFDRLEGRSADSFEQLSKARDLSQRISAYLILKGHYSALCCPDGHIVFNTTGNAGMATAGSGDVLTGILTGLLARGYSHRDACIVGMYLHGLAGDLAVQELGEESLIARDIIRYLPKAFLKLKKRK